MRLVARVEGYLGPVSEDETEFSEMQLGVRVGNWSGDFVG